MTCPNCEGSGVVDTSPPAVFSAPWLQSDTACPECDGTGEHAAADRSGLPQPPRHRGVTLPDGAPERWEVEGE